LKLLYSRKQPNYDIGKALAAASKHFKPRTVDEFHFYPYAKSCWIRHAWYISEQEPGIYNLLVELFKGEIVDANVIDECGRTLLWWAVQNRHEAIVQVLLGSDEVDTNLKNQSGQTPLLWAARNGHEAIVKLLLDSGKVDADSKD
jgi:ankyrin repeat protein